MFFLYTVTITIFDSQKKILDIGEGFTTKVDIDLKQKKIHLRGMGENVNRCHNKILDEIKELRSIELLKKVGNVVHKVSEIFESAYEPSVKYILIGLKISDSFFHRLADVDLIM